MDFNDFGNDLDESAEFLIAKLKELHPWDDEWDLKITKKLVPFYKEELEIIRINREIDDQVMFYFLSWMISKWALLLLLLLFRTHKS